MQALTEVGPLGPVGLGRGASAILHRSEESFEQGPLLGRKPGHLLNEFCCAHGLNLTQPADWANHDFSPAQRVDQVPDAPLQFQGLGGDEAGGFDGASVFDAQSPNPGGGQRLFRSTDALNLTRPSPAIELSRGENRETWAGEVKRVRGTK